MQHSFSQTYRYIARNKKRVVCSLHEDVLSFTVQVNNQLAKVYKYRYTEIDRVHLSLSDVSWHTIDIYFRDKTRLHLKSVVFFIERRDGTLRRPRTNDEDNALVRKNQLAYREFVIALHKHLNRHGNHQEIKFTHGNPWKKVLIGSVLIALTIVIPIMWHEGYYRHFFVFVISFIFLFLFNRKINFRKYYSPDDIPQKYLP